MLKLIQIYAKSDISFFFNEYVRQKFLTSWLIKNDFDWLISTYLGYAANLHALRHPPFWIVFKTT